MKQPINLVCLVCVAGVVLLDSSDTRADRYSDRPAFLSPVRTRNEVATESVKAQALVMEARILQRRGELAQALRKYQRGWRFDNEATTILKQIVPTALELGRVDEATRYALLLADTELEDPFLAERLAMLMSDQLEYDKSLQLYKRVLQLRTEDPENRNPIAMQYEMGRLYYLSEKHDQATQSFRSVLDAIEQGNSDEFSKAFRSAILKDAKPVYTLFGESFLAAGDYKTAAEMFRKADAAKPDQQWLMFQLARVDYRAGRYNESRDKLQSYVQQKLRFGGQTPYELLQDMMEQVQEAEGANVATEEKETEDENGSLLESEVFVRFRDWLADDPDNFPLMSYVAEMSRRRGILKDAVQIYERSIDKQPNVGSYQKLLALYKELGESNKLFELLVRVVDETGNFDAVEKQIESIVENEVLLGQILDHGRSRLESDDNAPKGIALACGLLALQAKSFDEADEFLVRLRKNTTATDLYLNWGLRLLLDEKYKQAAEAFQTGIDNAKDEQGQAVLLYYLSGALQLDDRTDEAMVAANRVAEIAKDIPEFALRPAWILYNDGQSQKSLAKYEEWLSKHAEDYSVPGLREVVRDARMVVSSICVELERPTQAFEWLEQVLDEFPRDAGAMNDLGYLMVDKGVSLERGTRMIRFAVNEEPENPMYRDSLGWAYFRLGKFELAVEELAKASSGDAPDPIILDHYAVALEATGKHESAKSVWQRALSLLEPGEEQELREKINRKLQNQLAESK